MTSPTPEALWSDRAARLLGPSAIHCRGLTRRTRGRRLLDGLDMVVPVGANVLLLSSPVESGGLLLRILAGLARHDGGRLQIAGLSRPGPEGWGPRVGYLGRSHGVPRWMSPREALEFSASLTGLNAPARRRRCDELLERLALGSVADRPIGRLSPPLAERAGLAATLISDPEVLLLDEPLRHHEAPAREMLLRPRGPRRTMLIAGRTPAAGRNICDHIAFIRDGRLALLSSVEELEGARMPLTREGIEELAGGRRSPSALSPAQ